MTPIILQCVCVTAPGMRGCALFPQAVTGAAAESSVTCPACVSVHEFLCLRVCLSFCLISTSCFILGVIQNATQLCSQPEKEGLGDGLPGPGESSHALQLRPTDGGEMGLPAWVYLLFVGQTDPHTNTIAHPLICP